MKFGTNSQTSDGAHAQPHSGPTLLVWPAPLLRSVISTGRRSAGRDSVPPPCFLEIAPLTIRRRQTVWLASRVVADAEALVGPRSNRRLARIEFTPRLPAMIGLPALLESLAPWVEILVVLGTQDLEGSYWAVGRREEGRGHQRVLCQITGPAMDSHFGRSAGHGQGRAALLEAVSQPNGRFSRFVNGIGGHRAYWRLFGWEIVLIGASGTGSPVADSLGRVGLLDDIIDPDKIEAHNLAKMALAVDDDVGEFKAVAMINRLVEVLGEDLCRAGCLPRAIPCRIESREARAALLEADLIMTCVDDDSARLESGIIATAGHKILMDVATGILFPASRSHPGAAPGTARLGAHPPPREMGADLRLILPGDGCILCRGGLRDFHGALATLRRGGAPQPSPTPGPPGGGARGAASVRSLNMAAAGVALQLLQDLAAGRITRSTWVRLEISPAGLPVISSPLPSQSARECPLCALAGLGDLVLGKTG